MKRNNNKRKVEHRMRRVRTILEEPNLSFDLTTPCPLTTHGIETFGNKGGGGDKVYCIIRFQPFLDKELATSSYLTITDNITKRQDTCIVVLPKAEHKLGVSYGDKLDYIQFSTHAVHVQDGFVCSIHLNLVNVQLQTDANFCIWEPDFNFGLGWFPDHFPGYTPLKFMPLDLQIDEDQPINLSKIPQGYCLSKFKPSGGITGHRTGKLLGYYHSTEPQKKWNTLAMRFGYLYEDVVKLIYLNAHKDYKFEEVGFISSSSSSCKSNDGCMPDGLVTLDNQTWPVEFKTSRKNSRDGFDGSNMAQCIWEMSCGPFEYMDLVKYTEKQVKEGEEWTIKAECKEVRLFRSKEAEANLIKLCQEAQQSKEFAKLIETEPFQKMRQYLDELAKGATESSKSLEIPTDLLKERYMYKKSVLDIQADDVLTTHPIIDRLEKRQATIFALQQDKKKAKQFRESVCEQIKDYSDLMSSSHP